LDSANLRRMLRAALPALAICATIFIAGAHAQGSAQNSPQPQPAVAPAPNQSVAMDPKQKQNLEDRLGIKVDAIVPMPFAGLYEVRAGDKLGYTDANGDYLFVGNIVDLRSHEDLTQKRMSEIIEASLPKVRFADLPLQSAIKIVKGTGKRQIATFQDPNCGFCKRFEKSLSEVTDVTVYVFLYPILGDDSVAKSKAIWCSANAAKTWTDWMQSGVALPAATNCKTPVDKNVELGKKLRVDGTPTMFFASGKRVAGAISAEELSGLLASQ